MKIAEYSSKPGRRHFHEAANASAGHELVCIDARLCPATTGAAGGVPVISIFVGDDALAPVLRVLHAGGTRLSVLRSAGFNHVNIAEAQRLGLSVDRVSACSPYAVAEHAVGHLLAHNRRFNRAFNRVRDQNFALDGLMGFDIHGKTADVIGTGKIGAATCAILHGFSSRVLAFGPVKNTACLVMGVEYVTTAELHKASDIVTLHCPLAPQTSYIVDADALAAMKGGVMLFNTGRGAIIETQVLIVALERGRVGSVGLDVDEEEVYNFFEDLSTEVVHDNAFMGLMSFPNVLNMPHRGFFTREACEAITQTTSDNAACFAKGELPRAKLVTFRLLASTAARPQGSGRS